MRGFSLTALFLLATSVSTAQAWVKKDPFEWSEFDCNRAQGLASKWTARDYAVGYPPAPGEWDAHPYLKYEATVLSAWTVKHSRLCLVLHSVQKEMDLSDHQKTEIERALTKTHPDTVVLQVHYSGTSVLEEISARFWGSKSQEDLAQAITFVADGVRHVPIRVELHSDRSGKDKWGRYEPVKGFEVVFTRNPDGARLITKNSKKVYLEIADPNGKVRLPFNVKKMIVDGELVY